MKYLLISVLLLSSSFSVVYCCHPMSTPFPPSPPHSVYITGLKEFHVAAVSSRKTNLLFEFHWRGLMWRPGSAISKIFVSLPTPHGWAQNHNLSLSVISPKFHNSSRMLILFSTQQKSGYQFSSCSLVVEGGVVPPPSILPHLKDSISNSPANYTPLESNSRSFSPAGTDQRPEFIGSFGARYPFSLRAPFLSVVISS